MLAPDRAILIHVNLPQSGQQEDLTELKMLVDSAAISSLGVMQSTRQTPHSGYFVGKGKMAEIAEKVSVEQASLIIFNHSLSPAQQRNIEIYCQCRVIDRTGLILDIFAQRARTHEGKLQVELAQLTHLSTRLIRGWTHLERQKGGIGLRGPGETQLETDRRLIGVRIKSITASLAKVARRRKQSRQSRIKADINTVALVGYTNAGKSTLFNQLTQGQNYVADQLFATLDPVLRRVQIPDVGFVIIADTVGFIRHLPHELIAAFKATLQETQNANLLLHVVDCSDNNMFDNISQVDKVLAQIQANDIPILQIMNKIDRTANHATSIKRDAEGCPRHIRLSAQQNRGIDLLKQTVGELLSGQIVEKWMRLSPNQGKLRSILYNYRWIQQELIDSKGNWLVGIRVPEVEWRKFLTTNMCSIQDFILN